MWKSFFVLLAVLPVLSQTPPKFLPASNAVKGWTIDKKGSCYHGATAAPRKLYDIIDGGAETYLDRGFVGGYFEGYASGKYKICVEIYDQGTKENALKLYQAPDFTRYGKYRIPGSPGDSCRVDESSPYSNTMEVLAGRCFIRMTLSTKDSTEEKAAVELGKFIVKNIQKESKK
jgi:hypothetical protein